MSMRLNRRAYEQAVRENIEWLMKQPDSLERHHIKMILDRAVEYEYGPAETAKEPTDDRRDAERWRKIRPALGVDGDDNGSGGDFPDDSRHVQWITVDEDKLPSREGWTHTVESLIDGPPLSGAAEAPTAPSEEPS